MKSRNVWMVALLLAGLLMPEAARASGLYFADRGVRPLSRGGAFVAGADDLGAVWYNPAGLVDAGGGFLFDASWLNYSAEFTRRVSVQDSSGALHDAQSPTVRGSVPFLPLPTVVGAWAFGEKKQLVAAFGVLAPETPLVSYPMTVDGAPASTRYSLVSLDGSMLVIPGLSVAYRPFDFLQVGAGVHAMVGTFVTKTVFGTSPPDRILSAPEDPAYDALAELRASGIVAPSASFGVIARPAQWLRLGFSGQLPFVIDAPASVRVKLPDAAVFDGATQEGDKARLRLKLPAILRAGVEVRPLENLRVEVGFAREFWSQHQSIDITPDNIVIHNVTGMPDPIRVPAMSIKRGFKDSNSFRLGGEYAFEALGLQLQGRAGVSYAQSAIPTAYVSPLTVDMDKVTGSVGLGLRVSERMQVDAVFSHVFGKDTQVSTSDAAVRLINPLASEDMPTEAINAGAYSARADILGVGVRYAW